MTEVSRTKILRGSGMGEVRLAHLPTQVKHPAGGAFLACLERPVPTPPWRLLVLLVLLTAASVGPAPPGSGQGGGAAGGDAPVYGMVFPLLGEHTLTDSFDDPRGRARRHQGVDVLADKGVPVVAVADGTVRWVQAERGGRCCDVALKHDDGWRSRYVHLDNDTPGTDDGRAVGIAPGVRRGARVVAGQVLGWVGDSGNAEDTVSHLHFELRRPDGTPVDPLPSLRAALRVGRPTVPAPVRGGGVAGGDGGDGVEGEPEERGGLLGWLTGGGAVEPDTPPAVEEVTPARGEGSPLAMERSVELVPAEVRKTAGGDATEEDREEAAAAEEPRSPGWLACFGFAASGDGA